MSRQLVSLTLGPRARGAAAVLAVLVAVPASAAARQTDAELRARLDSLLPLLEEARAAADAQARAREARRLAQSAVATDTIAVGPLRVIAREGQAELAAELFGAVWEREYAPFVAAPRRAGDAWFTFAWPAAGAELTVAGGTTVHRVELGAWRPRGAVEEAVRQQIAALLGAELAGTPLAHWMAGWIRAPRDVEATYRLAATTGAASMRDCLAGSAARCWDALAADLADDPDPLDDWYAPEERVAMARDLLARWPRGSSAPDPRGLACAERDSLEDCDATLADRFHSLGPLAPTARGDLRANLVWLALRAGGEGAWARLTSDPNASAGDALRAASGLDSPELASLWREELVRHRPTPLGVLDPSLFLALLWIGLFATLAARSTRWR